MKKPDWTKTPVGATHWDNHCQAIIDYYQGKVAEVVDDDLPSCPGISDSSDPASRRALEW